MSNRVSLRDLNEREVRRQREVDEAVVREWDAWSACSFDLGCDQHDEYEEFDLEAEFRDLEHDYEREIQEGFARDRTLHMEDRYANNRWNDGPEHDSAYFEWDYDEHVRPYYDSEDEGQLPF